VIDEYQSPTHETIARRSDDRQASRAISRRQHGTPLRQHGTPLRQHGTPNSRAVIGRDEASAGVLRRRVLWRDGSRSAQKKAPGRD
jgi:hypothetical protein